MPRRSLAERRSAAQLRTRAVRLAKIGLPLLALGIVAAIFLSGRERGTIEDVLSAEELARLGAGLRLDQPRFTGVTPDGAPFALRARAALPDGAMPDLVGLEAPEGEIRLEDGKRLTGRSIGGTFRRGDRALDLEGEVVLELDGGYRFETERLSLDFEARTANAPGAIRGTGPDAEIEAGRMRVLSENGRAEDAVVRFEGGVRVLFTPSASE